MAELRQWLTHHRYDQSVLKFFAAEIEQARQAYDRREWYLKGL